MVLISTSVHPCAEATHHGSPLRDLFLQQHPVSQLKLFQEDSLWAGESADTKYGLLTHTQAELYTFCRVLLIPPCTYMYVHICPQKSLAGMTIHNYAYDTNIVKICIT